MPDKSLILSFYVPEDSLEKVLEAIFDAGAGRYKDYDRCVWTTRGEGRFRPLKGSNPYIGRVNEDTRVEEIKVECLVQDRYRQAVERALIDSHPYEEPAYHFIVKKVI